MIEFQTEEIPMPEFDAERVRRWVEAVAAGHGRRVGDIVYRFCDDEYILQANRDFIGHDYYTDIITFDYSRHDRISGDILISVDTVASNADGLGISRDSELLRVIIHGILHLCGINDKLPGEREVMERHENEALELYETL